MPARYTQTSNLDDVVNVRVTSPEKGQLREAAHLAGLTVSAYSRRRLLGRRVMASVDAAMLRELRRVGGLLKHIHADSDGAYSHATAEALSAVKGFIERLAQEGSRRDR